MKVFISWSGTTSFKVAKTLKEWIPCVIQDVQPYFSSEDIDKGARWSTDIAKELEAASFGILCVTKDNLKSQWLNFEAGALSKAIDKSKVCPLLFRLKPSDISNSPILQFQMANVEKNDIFKLFKSMNTSLEDAGLDEARLEKVFNTFWPEMEKDFNSIDELSNNSTEEKEKEDGNTIMLEEMLDLLRLQQMMLKSPEKMFPIEYVQEVLQQLQKEGGKNAQNKVPIKVVTDLERDEAELVRIITEVSVFNDEHFEMLRTRVKRYISSTRRVMKFLGIQYPAYYIFHDRE